jgi:hypothetical protein
MVFHQAKTTAKARKQTTRHGREKRKGQATLTLRILLLTSKAALATKSLLATVARLLTTVATGESTLRSTVTGLLTAVTTLATKTLLTAETARLLAWWRASRNYVSNKIQSTPLPDFCKTHRSHHRSLQHPYRRPCCYKDERSKRKDMVRCYFPFTTRDVALSNVPSWTRVGHVDANATTIKLLLV